MNIYGLTNFTFMFRIANYSQLTKMTVKIPITLILDKQLPQGFLFNKGSSSIFQREFYFLIETIQQRTIVGSR